MRKTWIIASFLSVGLLSAQEKSLEELLNYTVGGVWISENQANDHKPESFESFFMEFQNWSSRSSVTADIYGIKNNGDTLQLMEVWNYIIPSQKDAILVQRTAWGAHSTGTVALFESQHLNITFRTTNPDGSTYWTRDIHFIISKNEMKAETYYRTNQKEEWEKTNESYWTRKF